MRNLFLIIVFGLSISSFAQNNPNYKGRLSFTMDPIFAPFYHGVASGDPLSDAVIIWTRVTPLGSIDSINVEWSMATDTLFNNTVASGSVWTKESVDYTVKVDVTGLQPNTWYYYKFNALGSNSIIGRTRTFPVGDCDSIRIAVVSGTNYNNGYFNSLGLLTPKNDIDCIFHTGDYIYEYATNEYGNNPDRELSPNWECTNLSDYRMRYGLYRLDPDLRYAHQQYPWIVIYDDHETANNSWHDGAENHDSSTEGNWNDRKSDGIRAFEEWIPIREINDTANPDNHIHRTLPIGDLANIILIDTRLEGRDDPEGLDIDDQNKTMLGANQYTWLTNELYRSEYTNPVKWKFIGNQVMFAPLLIAGIVANKDQWDGYRFERQKILNLIYGWGIKNTVILTGDIHTSWANDVPNQTMGPYGSNGQGSGTVEFVAPSITSPSIDIGGGLGASVIQSSNAHIKWVDLVNRGYYILDINKQRTQADWYLTSDITTHGGAYEYIGSIWYVNENESFLRQGAVPSIRLNPNPPLAPLYPVVTDIDNTNIGLFSILSINPNPFNDHIYIQFYSRSVEKITLQIFTDLGTVIDQYTVNAGTFDLDHYQINTKNYPVGTYFIRVTDSKGYNETKKLIKIY